MNLTPKRLVTLILFFFVACSIAYLLIQELRPGKTFTNTTSKDQEVVSAKSANASVDASEKHTDTSAIGKGEQSKSTLPQKTHNVNSTPPVHKIIAYYFHTTTRCVSCRTIEAFSQEAIQTGFEGAIKNGSLQWHVINTDEPGNEHYVDDYKLYTKSVIIVEIVNGKQTRWKNLEKVWELLQEKETFIKYVQREVQEYVQKAS